MTFSDRCEIRNKREELEESHNNFIQLIALTILFTLTIIIFSPLANIFGTVDNPWGFAYGAFLIYMLFVTTISFCTNVGISSGKVWKIETSFMAIGWCALFFISAAGKGTEQTVQYSWMLIVSIVLLEYTIVHTTYEHFENCISSRRVFESLNLSEESEEDDAESVEKLKRSLDDEIDKSDSDKDIIEKLNRFTDNKKKYRYANAFYAEYFCALMLITNILCSIVFIASDIHWMARLMIIVSLLTMSSYIPARKTKFIVNGEVKVSLINKIATGVVIFISIVFASVGTPLSCGCLFITSLFGGALMKEISIQYEKRV